MDQRLYMNPGNDPHYRAELFKFLFQEGYRQYRDGGESMAGTFYYMKEYIDCFLDQVAIWNKERK